jgi:hypothetical protein
MGVRATLNVTGEGPSRHLGCNPTQKLRGGLDWDTRRSGNISERSTSVTAKLGAKLSTNFA